MATVQSDQMVEGYRKRPFEEHGKLRFLTAYFKNRTGGTLADGTEIDLGDLPPGAVRIVPYLSRYRTVVAGGASRVLDIGFRAYASKYNPNPQALEVEDDDALVANKDISAAVAITTLDAGNDIFVDLYSRGGVRVYATIDGGTIPADLELEVAIAYIYE